jgi:hypothetical protein
MLLHTAAFIVCVVMLTTLTREPTPAPATRLAD